MVNRLERSAQHPRKGWDVVCLTLHKHALHIFVQVSFKLLASAWRVLVDESAAMPEVERHIIYGSMDWVIKSTCLLRACAMPTS
jgi:hypothetical protein